MNKENVFYSKYIKYKQKYFLLKGGDKTCNCKKCKSKCNNCINNIFIIVKFIYFI